MTSWPWLCWGCRHYSAEHVRACEHCGRLRPDTVQEHALRLAEAERQIRALRVWADSEGVAWH